jgi:hypothetical protein
MIRVFACSKYSPVVASRVSHGGGTGMNLGLFDFVFAKQNEKYPPIPIRLFPSLVYEYWN